MLGFINRLGSKFGVRIVRVQPARDYHNTAFVSLAPEGDAKGRVLLSYVIDPFLREPGQPISNDHTHHWESYQIAQTFLTHGYSVDAISYQNERFRPERRYDFFVGVRTNFERISAQLNTDCRKVVHLDTSHWLFNNAAAYQRLLAVKERRGIVLHNVKMVSPNWALEHADEATVLGNEFTIETYRYANKPLMRIPISNPLLYEWDEKKNFEGCRRNYIWFGSSGFVHKGLDLALEAFAQLPDYKLYVCGPLDQEAEFVQAYYRELFETPNIQTIGWVDVASDRFKEIARDCVGVVYPTCAEGGGGSVITCMHAGMIPVVSYEASVDVDNTGVVLGDSDIETIKKAVVNLSARSPVDLAAHAKSAWTLARERHTRDQFAQSYDAYVQDLLSKGSWK